MIYSGAGPNYESFYSGGYSSLNPEYGGFVGKRIPAGQLGQAMNPMTANQLKETMNTLKTGTQEVEVQMLGIQNDVDQQIPKEHFKEIRSLLKLSGARASLHGPILDSAGFSQQKVSETTRQENERRYFDAVEKAHELDPKGNIHVVFHASNGTPGPTYVADKTKKPGDKDRFYVEEDYAINRDNGQIAPIKRETKYYPRHPSLLKDVNNIEGSGEVYEANNQIDTINNSEWANKLTELAQFNKFADEVIGSSALVLEPYKEHVIDPKTQEFVNYNTNERIKPSNEELANFQKLHDADVFLSNVELNFSSAFDKAYKYGTPEEREYLKKISEEYAKENEMYRGEIFGPIKKRRSLQKAINNLKQINPPAIYQAAEDYAKDKSSETFSNVALEAYKEFKGTMPTIAIENYAPGTAFHRADKLKELIDDSRKKFVQKLVDEEGVSKSKAQQIAQDRIGATWDVGHVNLFKKYGWTDEEVVEETAKIAKDVKHLHLTDNFGFSDSHLIPGMGNVPFKKHLEELEKKGVLNKVRKIVEAGGYIQQISQVGAHGDSISAFNSPIYGAKMDSYWNKAEGMRGNYFGGYGTINPSIHHSSVYGAGFTSLPTEVGGNIPGGGSRFSGNSMS